MGLVFEWIFIHCGLEFLSFNLIRLLLNMNELSKFVTIVWLTCRGHPGQHFLLTHPTTISTVANFVEFVFHSCFIILGEFMSKDLENRALFQCFGCFFILKYSTQCLNGYCYFCFLYFLFYIDVVCVVFIVLRLLLYAAFLARSLKW